ncbi:helix-turn-helix domain-containing protein [Pseudonocardia sp. NPDC049154]|uniref:helix-turn-helix transcriptional regulator n=1 Tax=Pseudonocardia sp. NPDC049154 TaxID=3155501 RepID=UPI0033FAC532
MSAPVERDRVLAALADPRRRAIHEFAVGARRAVTRDEVAAAVGLARPTAAFHLDQLVEAGLLETSFARPPGRSGPGAGRPAKHYAVVETELDLSLPPRDYARLAGILVEAAGDPDDDNLLDQASNVAYARGKRDAAQLPAQHADVRQTEPEQADLLDLLGRLGYVGHRTPADRIELRNCPFRSLADRSPEVVCVVNERYLAGLVAGLGLHDRYRVVGDGVSPDCCVTLTPRSTGS